MNGTRHGGAEKKLAAPTANRDLRTRRKALGLTLKQLAAEASMRPEAVCRAERGTHSNIGGLGVRAKKTSPETLARIAAALDRLDAAKHAPALSTA